MTEKYLCHECCDTIGITSNEIAVNECGRKDCYGCGDRDDWRLHYASQDEIDGQIDSWKKRVGK
jgi:hypothetical protein